MTTLVFVYDRDRSLALSLRKKARPVCLAWTVAKPERGGVLFRCDDRTLRWLERSQPGGMVKRIATLMGPTVNARVFTIEA